MRRKRKEKRSLPGASWSGLGLRGSADFETLAGGRDLLLAPNKSGIVFALDPDRKGGVVWKTNLAEREGSRATNLVWGGAADQRNFYVGLVSGAISAIQFATGEKLWTTRLAEAGSRESNAAVTSAIPGAVFLGGTDGKLHALASADGRELWSFDTAREFPAVNQVPRVADRSARSDPPSREEWSSSARATAWPPGHWATFCWHSRRSSSAFEHQLSTPWVLPERALFRQYHPLSFKNARSIVSVMKALSRIVSVAMLLATGLGAADAARPALIDATRNGDRVAFRVLLQKRADVNLADADGSTALHWAAYRDDLEFADALIRAGAKASAVTDLGVTPLWLASQNGSSDMVRKLLQAGANANRALLSGETPLMVGARSGYPEIAEQLLAGGADPNARGSRGQTALMWAVAQKHPQVVKVLLAHGAGIQLRSEAWSEVMAVPPHGYLPYNKAIPHGGETALMFAARVGDLDSAKLLVGAGASVNDVDAWGVSATVLAAHSGFRDMAGFFLDKGADPNAAEAGFSALHEAIMRRDERMVAALLDHGADANAPLKTWTPTRRSSEDFHFEPSLVGATPFWLAARYLEPGVMRLLAKHGADPMFVFHASWVGSQGTGQQARSESSTALLAATGIGGDNGNRDSSGAAAWVPPPRSQREALTLEAVKVALELGIDVNAKSNDGRTALDGARSLKYESVVQFLIEKGAKPGTATTARPRGRVEN